ncbi:hypothetical protein JS530_02265 [Bifidobacterium sp. LC6]|uniref:Uncharacterized protein n=1 Tax=Bifidobacterium colobi TaxID=2809026 RepID=A0ABS5UTM4_9BIFI|nr:hypothetical protein [Bifidobacterium colobi]MBT1174344.1 hypothetical protein [Bifidobacterium colobi]
MTSGSNRPGDRTEINHQAILTIGAAHGEINAVVIGGDLQSGVQCGAGAVKE